MGSGSKANLSVPTFFYHFSKRVCVCTIPSRLTRRNAVGGEAARCRSGRRIRVLLYFQRRHNRLQISNPLAYNNKTKLPRHEKVHHVSARKDVEKWEERTRFHNKERRSKRARASMPPSHALWGSARCAHFYFFNVIVGVQVLQSICTEALVHSLNKTS